MNFSTSSLTVCFILFNYQLFVFVDIFLSIIPPNNISDKLHAQTVTLLKTSVVSSLLCFPRAQTGSRWDPVYTLNNASVFYFKQLFSVAQLPLGWWAHCDVGPPPRMIWCSTTQLMPFQYKLHGCGPTSVGFVSIAHFGRFCAWPFQATWRRSGIAALFVHLHMHAALLIAVQCLLHPAPWFSGLLLCVHLLPTVW